MFYFNAKTGQFKNVKNKKYLDGTDSEGANVKLSASAAAKWEIIYSNKMEKIKTSGLNKNFGLEINRNFYIVSKLPMERALTNVGANNVVLKRLQRNNSAQLFYFDGTTKTIKSRQYTGRSLQIDGSGKSKNVNIATTNARWW
jgi:hypothetical protein